MRPYIVNMFFSNFFQARIIQVDFSKTWWQLFTKQKGIFLFITISVSLLQIFLSLLPFLVAQVFASQSFFWCVVLFVLWILLELNIRLGMSLNQRFQLTCIHSIYYGAHEFLLTIDPKYHVFKASGALQAKIERAARAYEDFADYVTHEYTPLIIGLITVIITLGYYSINLAFIMAVFIIGIVILGYYLIKYVGLYWERKFIRSDDIFKTTAHENLAQINLIRTTFSTDFRIQKLADNVFNNMHTEARLWFMYSMMFFILNLVYVVSLFVLALMLLWQVNNNTTTISSAIGLFLAYMQSSKDIPRILRLFRKTGRSITRIKDLFEFLPLFGKQSFPVINNDHKVEKSKIISVKAHNIYFDYGKAILFNDHSFSLTRSTDQPNLLGIIGPSGSGKSTLLSILGGQLKPIKGSVLINNINIYEVSDHSRRQLIALQGQTATTLQGTLENNLLLGMSPDVYDEDQLLLVLERVGLLSVFEYEGLQTNLGEGGLNLSGGQRQRLNFAGLYLRARYYKPSLILIDEPTSSLDALSEKAITDMIQELAYSAVTFVIAHRLKTLEHAQGLLDLSLLPQIKDMHVYTAEQLMNESEYYRQLIKGNISLDA